MKFVKDYDYTKDEDYGYVKEKPIRLYAEEVSEIFIDGIIDKQILKEVMEGRDSIDAGGIVLNDYWGTVWAKVADHFDERFCGPVEEYKMVFNFVKFGDCGRKEINLFVLGYPRKDEPKYAVAEIIKCKNSNRDCREMYWRYIEYLNFKPYFEGTVLPKELEYKRSGYPTPLSYVIY